MREKRVMVREKEEEDEVGESPHPHILWRYFILVWIFIYIGGEDTGEDKEVRSRR